MIDGKRILGLIPARGGSKRLHGKNLVPLDGHPLIAWTIAAGRASSLIDRLILSSDDLDIMAAAETIGCEVPFHRPADLATDGATSEAMARHALDSLGEAFDYLVLLQPTSPFRLAEDIDHCVRLCHEGDSHSVISVCDLEAPADYFMAVQSSNRMCSPLLDGSPLTRPSRINGAVYVVSVPWFQSHGDFYGDGTLAHFMPRERSVDIDTANDLAWAKHLLAQGSISNPLITVEPDGNETLAGSNST